MRRLPSFFALRAFEAAARCGRFNEAAEELSLTPSAISHQVRALEAWFGRPLFVRGTRSVTLTDEGRRLMDTLTDAFDRIEEGCAALRPAVQRRELAVHCAPSFAAKWLSPRLADFMQAHPGLTMRMSSSAEPADLLKDVALDVDIAYGAPPSRNGVAVEPLGDESIVPLVAPRLLGDAPARAPRDVLRHTLIESKLNPVHWSDWCRLNGVRLPDRARPSFDRGSLAVAAAVDGLGVALESTRFAQAELARGDLVVVEGDAFRHVVRPMHFLCYRRADANEDRIVALRQWLGAQLAASDAPARPKRKAARKAARSPRSMLSN